MRVALNPHFQAFLASFLSVLLLGAVGFAATHLWLECRERQTDAKSKRKLCTRACACVLAGLVACLTAATVDVGFTREPKPHTVVYLFY